MREAAHSGKSIREFCRRHKLKEIQFYWWQHKLRAQREKRALRQGTHPTDIGRNSTQGS
ncbi:transposase [Verrucomicrobiota bacterium]